MPYLISITQTVVLKIADLQAHKATCFELVNLLLLIHLNPEKYQFWTLLNLLMSTFSPTGCCSYQLHLDLSPDPGPQQPGEHQAGPEEGLDRAPSSKYIILWCKVTIICAFIQVLYLSTM